VLLSAALRHPRRPWVVYASSREVYGQQSSFPVSETAQLGPLNTYARSKVAAEQLVWQAREAGLPTAVARFSSVYGDVDDHVDRVVPAFAAAAAEGAKMHIYGADCIFDFTHVEDVAAGVAEICRVISKGERKMPALHFVSGVPTSLRALAEAAADAGGRRATFEEGPPRTYDVGRFWGSPARTAEILGWRSTIAIRDGIAALVKDFEASAGSPRATSWSRVFSPAVSL
jgi:nucleoside-diphosphate-sugar epimerase